MPIATTAPSEASHPPHMAFGLLCGLFPLACLGFGTVHALPRAVFAVVCIGLGWRLWRAGRYAHTAEIRALKLLTVGAVFISALAFLPVTPGLRALLQPGISSPIEEMLLLSGGGLHPLALDPWRGLIEWAVGVGLLAVGWGALAWVSRAHRGWALSWALVGTGLLVLLLSVVQLALITQLGPESVALPEGIPQPSFGPFVNPNHGGALCAALMPLALALAFTGTIQNRVLGGMSMLALSAGGFMSGSRGAVVALGVGAAVTLFAAGSRRMRGLVLVVVLAVVGWVLAAGPAEVLRALGDLVAPEVSAMVDAGYVDLTTGRRSLLGDVWKLALGVWPLGVGAGGFDNAYQIAKSTPAFNLSQHAHNDLMQVMVEHGAVVGLCWLTAGVVAARVVVQGLQRSGSRPDRMWLMAGFMGTCASICATAMVDFPVRLGSHGLLIALAAGAALGLAREKKRGHRATPAWRRSIGGLSILGLCAVGVAGVGTVHPVPHFGQVAPIMEAGDVVEVLRRMPTHRRAAQLWARDLVREGKVGAAHEVLSTAAELYPTMPWLWRDQARLYQREGKTEQAQRMWRAMLELDLPGRADPLPFVREALGGGADPYLLSTALTVLPARADRRRQGAQIFLSLGLRKEAEALFKDALERDPTRVGAYATALVRWGRPVEALAVLEGGRDGCGTRQLRGSALMDMGKYKASVTAYERATAKCGRSSWTLQAGLGKARLLSGDEKGVDLVERLLGSRPGAHGLRRVLVKHLITRGRTTEAAPHIEHLVLEGVATPGELHVLSRAQRGLPVRLQDLTRTEVP